MKTYAFADEIAGTVTVSELHETDPEVQEGQAFIVLEDNDSKLALRYGYKDGKIVDLYPGLSDEGVLAKLLSDQKSAASSAGIDDLSVAKKTKLSEIRTYYNGIA